MAVPIEKLQRLVELCSQVLRESRTKHPGEPDLEKGQVYGNETTQATVETIQIDPRSRILFNVSHYWELPQTYESKKTLIEDIWKRVEPWHIKKVSVTEGGVISSKKLSSFTHKEDLPLLFKSHTEQLFLNYDRESKWNELDAKALAWRYEGTANTLPGSTVIRPYEGSTECFDKSTLISVMACCCCTEFEGKLQVGAILECCYQNGVLIQPENDIGYGWHITLVIRCSYLLNRTFYIDILSTFEQDGAESSYFQVGGKTDYQIMEMLTRRNSMQEILGIDIMAIFQILHMLNPIPVPLESSSGLMLRIDDLNISALKSIGGLTIHWTTLVENHLRLDLEKMTLSIAWGDLPRRPSAFTKLQQV